MTRRAITGNTIGAMIGKHAVAVHHRMGTWPPSATGPHRVRRQAAQETSAPLRAINSYAASSFPIFSASSAFNLAARALASIKS